VILGGHGELWPTDWPACCPQTVKGLWARHFMDEVKVDVEQIRLTFGSSHDV